MTNVSLNKILNADEKTQYYTSTGGVANRGILAPLGRFIKPLRDVPYIGVVATPIINWFVKRHDADIYKFCERFQITVNDIADAGGGNNPDLQKAVKKVNDQLDHIAEKRPQDKKFLAVMHIRIPVPKPTTPTLPPSSQVEDIDSSEGEEHDPFADFDQDPVVSTPPKNAADGSPELVDSFVVDVADAVPQTLEEILTSDPELAARQAERGHARFGKGQLDAHDELEAAKSYAQEVHIPAAAPASPEVIDLSQEQAPATPAPNLQEEPVAPPPTPVKPKPVTMKRTQLQFEPEDAVEPKRKRGEKKEVEKMKPVEEAAPAVKNTRTGRSKK